MPHVPRNELLTFEEIDRLVSILRRQGVRHVRLTGGEPLVRKGINELMNMLGRYEDIDLSITTNGVLLERHLDTLVKNKIRVNISLDSLNRETFAEKTRRDELPAVLRSLHAALGRGIHVRLNAVVSHENEKEHVLALARLAQQHNLHVRFIEKMKFDGHEHNDVAGENLVAGATIMSWMSHAFPELVSIPRPSGATADMMSSSTWNGQVGVINSRSRTFCSDCNRIRIGAVGTLRLCLYGQAEADVRAMLRSDLSDGDIATQLASAVLAKPENGFVAEQDIAKQFVAESMISIGG